MLPLLVLVLVLAFPPQSATPLSAPAPPPPSLTPDLTPSFTTLPTLRVELFAESPHLSNPTAIDVDERGRLFVAEAVNYRQWDHRNPGLTRPEGDRIVLLEDTDHDGACDRSTVFAQSPDLISPLGVCVLPSGPRGERRILVSCSPTAWLYTDDDDDGVSDRREPFLTGFGGHDHDHGLHSCVVAPDGRLWFAVGNAGPHRVTDRDHFALRSGSIYRDGGAAETDNTPGLVSDDGRVWTGGLILRVDPDGGNLRVMAHNLRNPYEVALDSWGRFYTADNDDDGNQACRTLRCMEGGNHGYFSADGSRTWTADRRPGSTTASAHWHADDPGVVPSGTVNGAGAPGGVCFYESRVLAPSLFGCVLDADAGRSCVWSHRAIEKAAGCRLESGVLLGVAEGDERAASFRPSDVCVAPDGSVFVADWSDPVVGGHAMRDTQGYGRILHLVPRDPSKLEDASFDLSTAEGRARALNSPNLALRAQAGAAVRAAQDPPEEKKIAIGRARAVWARMGTPAERAALEAALRDPWPQVRALAVKLIRAKDPGAGPALRARVIELAHDSHPEVRAEVAIALRDWIGSDVVDALVAIAKDWDGEDRWYLEAFGIGAEGRESELWTRISAELDAHDPRAWPQYVAALAWRLHPARAVPAWTVRAREAALPIEARMQAIDALAFTHERTAAEAVLDLAVDGPADTRAYAAWWIRNRDTNEWSAWKLARELGGDTLDDAEMIATTGILKSGSKKLVAELDGARKLHLVATEGENGQSCDWADWIEPRIVTASGTIDLAETPWSSASAAWGSVNRDRNCTGGPLLVDGEEYANGIGTHARSTITFDLPGGAQRLEVIAAVDDGGSKQPSRASDVEFQVWIDGGARRARLRDLAAVLARADAEPAVIEAAASELCADRDGGQRVLRMAAEKQLSPAARAAVAKRIFANPDLAVRALAGQHFPRTDRTGKPLPGVARIAAMPGDPARGAATFFGPQAGCGACHTLHGRGGDVGPDLSAVRTKYKAEELLDAILNPSAAIALGYDAWVVETKDEELITGFVLSRGERVVMKDTTGRRHVVPASEIVLEKKQTTSLMPDDAALGLTAQDLADLVALLSTDPARPRKRGTPIDLFDGRGLEGWTCFLSDPKARMEDVWSVQDGVLRCKGEPAGYLRTVQDYTSFELDVEWRFDPKEGPGNSGVLLRVQEPDVVWPKSIEAQLQHRNAGDIWNIGEFSMQTDEKRTQGRHTDKMRPSNEKPVGEWNRYHIVLDRGELVLEVNGEVQNRASWCEIVPGKIALQSEGAVIEFRSVRLTPIE